MIGETISHYKILEKLGEGGMGVVYKAQDTKLNRTVALKFLPTHVSGNETDKARFLLEAQAAAALNHPNICTIYGIEEHDGNVFIAMELIDGQTLKDKRGTISFKQAIDIGIQIADGLAAAHEKGIVHRDIKPENIMIRKDGIAQIMDFGLAKLRTTESKISRLTKQGSTVGTAGYMSPEQVQGQDTDHRSDIFSLGILLYELLTGQLPFKGVHETALLYEIVNVEAVPISAVKPEIDPELDRIVLECLDKDPNERTQSAKQVSIDLKRFKRVSSRQHLSRSMSSRPAMTLSSSQASASPHGETTQRSSPKREIIAWTAAGVMLLVLLFTLFKAQDSSGNASRFIRSSIVTPESLYIHSYGGASGRPIVSPDGHSVAFTGILPDGIFRIYVRSLDDNEVRFVAGTENGTSPFWSPDGKMLGFFSADGKMKKVDLAGGNPTTIATVLNQRGAAWSQDNIIVYCPDYQSGLFRVNADGKSEPVKVTTLDSTRHEGSHRWPAFLPDGKHFLYLARTAVNAGEAEGDAVFVGSLDGTVRSMLVQTSFNASYANGYLLFVRGASLMAQRFDSDKLSVTGDPVKVQDGVLNDPSYNIAVFTVSDNGILLYQPGETQGGGARPLLMDRAGKILQTVGDNLLEQDQPRFSPDGKQIAMYMYDLRSRRSNIWIYDIQANSRRRLTTRAEGDFFPIWSPDGKDIFFSSGSIGNSHVFVQSVSRSGNEQQVYSSSQNEVAQDITPDGSTIIFESLDLSKNTRNVFLLPLKGDKLTPIPFQTTSFDEHDARLSNDGTWLAYVSDESGGSEVYIKKLSEPQGNSWKISSGGGFSPLWGMGTNELVYVSSQNQVVAAVLQFTGNGAAVKETKVLFNLPPFFSQYDISPDGKQFVISRSIEIRRHPFLALVTDWVSRVDAKQ